MSFQVITMRMMSARIDDILFTMVTIRFILVPYLRTKPYHPTNLYVIVSVQTV